MAIVEATGILNYSGMIDVANENGFALCVPQGTSDGSGYNFWNVGYDFHQNQNVDDVDFINVISNASSRTTFIKS